ncbi:MAG: hypothetical protein ACPKQO_05360 [Nitrososphaeraceae archaeon]
MKVNLEANVPNYIDFSIYVIIAIEILASALLVFMILIVVYSKEAKRFKGLDIFYLD